MLLAQVVSAAAATPAASWSPGPFYQALEPYLVSAAVAVFMGIFGWLAAIFQKHTGIQIVQKDRDAVQTAAMNAAGRVFQAGEGSIDKMTVAVTSPLIQAEIPIVTAAVKTSIDNLGMTPDRVGALITGKLGQLQAQAQSVTPPVVVVPEVK